MPKLLKESQAWRKIARKVAEGCWHGTGLCWEVRALYFNGQISWEMKEHLLDTIRQHKALYCEDTLFGDWVFPSGESDVRVLAALLLADEAESEGR